MSKGRGKSFLHSVEIHLYLTLSTVFHNSSINEAATHLILNVLLKMGILQIWIWILNSAPVVNYKLCNDFLQLFLLNFHGAGLHS